jgi:hypothetical protein
MADGGRHLTKRRRREIIETTKQPLDIAANEAAEPDLRERIQAAVDASWHYGMTLEELIDAIRKRFGIGHGGPSD